MEELLSHIVEGWFLTEPLMFAAWLKPVCPQEGVRQVTWTL